MQRNIKKDTIDCCTKIVEHFSITICVVPKTFFYFRLFPGNFGTMEHAQVREVCCARVFVVVVAFTMTTFCETLKAFVLCSSSWILVHVYILFCLYINVYGCN